MRPTPWLLRHPGDLRNFRLYCFCYAGGNAASFMEWQTALDPAIELCVVQLPGRNARFHETPYSDLTALISALADVIRLQPSMPFALFGHSLGALLAFELARHNLHRGFPMPQHIFASGCDAPRYRSPSRGLSRLDDTALIAELERYNGTPPEVLANRELMALVLPAIRADFALVENYRYRPGLLLDMPITVLAGKADDYDSPEQVSGWQDETRNTCRIQWFEGGHFFINTEKRAVLDCINSEIRPLLGMHRAAATQ